MWVWTHTPYGGWFGNILGLVHTHKLLCIKYTS